MVDMTINFMIKYLKSLFATFARNLYSNHTSLYAVDSTTVNLVSNTGSINIRMRVAPTAVPKGRVSNTFQIKQLIAKSMSSKSIALITKVDAHGWENWATHNPTSSLTKDVGMLK